MKKIFYFALISILSAVCLTSCASKPADDGKLHIVTTIFPEYDWVMNVLGDEAENADVTMLVDSGTDVHSYKPTATDMMKISDADVFIYVGGESDEWVEDALEDARNKDMRVICLLDVLGNSAKEEEIVEGMQLDADDIDDLDDADDIDDDDMDDEPEYDEHVWLSLKNAETFVNRISVVLGQADPDNAETYYANAEAYNKELSALDAEYKAAVDSATTKTLVFGDRFPFRYLTDDYGLNYYAAFVGCSAESEASFETVTFLAKKVDSLGVDAVMTIDKSDGKLAETIIKNTKSKDQEILTLNSMQAVSANDVKDGASYLTIMKDNLEVLKKALN